MSKEAVNHEIIVPMQRLFAPPRANMTDDERAAALGEYLDSLEHFSDDALRAGWRHTRELHLRGTWPPIALLVLECRKASPKPDAPTSADQRAEEDRRFQRACDIHGLNPAVMRRPNLWWLRPRDVWHPDWKESEAPKTRPRT